MSHPPNRGHAIVSDDSTRHSFRECRRHLKAAFPRPTWSEAATMLSFPTLLFVVHFAVQPVYDAWPRLGYVRAGVVATAPPQNVAPLPLTPYVGLWHELTRVSHALVHQPSSTHAHLLGNVALILLASWALLAALVVLGRRRSFSLFYWELVVVAPVVGSFAFDLFGQTPHGYGASTVGFAFLGVVASVSLFALLETRQFTRKTEPTRAELVRTDGGTGVSPLVVSTAFVFVIVVIVADVLAHSPATPVHQAGVWFGVVVGAVLVPVSDWF